jgi:hypothetical protein
MQQVTHLVTTAHLRLTQGADQLAPTERLFDTFADALADRLCGREVHRAEAGLPAVPTAQPLPEVPGPNRGSSGRLLHGRIPQVRDLRRC